MPVSVREPGAHFRTGWGGPIHLLDHAHDWRCRSSFIKKTIFRILLLFQKRLSPKWRQDPGQPGPAGPAALSRATPEPGSGTGLARTEPAMRGWRIWRRHAIWDRAVITKNIKLICVDFKTPRKICRERRIQATRRHLGILDCLDFLLRHLRIRDQDEAQGLSARVPMPGAVRITRGLQSGSMR